jgi:hypothetical protein
MPRLSPENITHCFSTVTMFTRTRLNASPIRTLPVLFIDKCLYCSLHERLMGRSCSCGCLPWRGKQHNTKSENEITISWGNVEIETVEMVATALRLACSRYLKLSTKEVVVLGQEGRGSSNELLCMQLSPTADNKQPVFLGSDTHVPQWKQHLSMNTSAVKCLICLLGLIWRVNVSEMH